MKMRLLNAREETKIPSNNTRIIPIETSDTDMGPKTPMIINTEEKTNIDFDIETSFNITRNTKLA